MHRRRVLITALAALTVRPPFAAAAPARDFDPGAFRTAQEAGRSIVVQVHASW